MFPVAALIMKIIFFAFFYGKIHCLTSEFQGKSYAKNRYRMNHKAMNMIIGFSSEIYFGIHQFGHEFFLNRVSFKRKQQHPQRANEKGKKPFQSQ